MIEVVPPPQWLAWIDSGIGLPPEPPTRDKRRRPNWDWFEILLGLYLAWLAINVLDDIMRWRTAHAAG